MKRKIALLLMLLGLSNIKAQIQPSLSIPNPIPEYNGTFEDFGQNHLFYPNEHEIRFANDDRSSAFDVVKFYTKFTYPQEYLLSNNNISFVFSKSDTIEGGSGIDSLHRIDIEMDRGSTTAFLARVDTQNTAILNYFDETYGASGRTDVRGGAAIAVQSIYPNIDMVYLSNNKGLKIYYIIYPGGDPNQIILNIIGAKSNYLTTNGELVLEANWEDMTFAKPKFYQYTYVGNVVTPVNVCPATWSSIGSNKYGFTTTGSWSTSLPLIIQVSQGTALLPAIANIDWSTYFGGSSHDYLNRIKSDANNNLFTAGWTISTNFPQASGAMPFQATKNTGYDCFVSKFNSNGVLQWSTYFGGSSSETVLDFDFSGGDIYCGGWTTSLNFPVQNKSGAFFDNTFNGIVDAFLFQIDIANGGTNKWTTYFGGDDDDVFNGLKFDGSGNLFVVGGSSSTNLGGVVTGPGGSYQQNYNSSQVSGSFPIHDCILLKFLSSSSLNWFTFYGGHSSGFKDDLFNAIDIHGSDIYCVGKASQNLPNVSNSFSSAGNYDGVLAKFTTGGAFTASRYTNGNTENFGVKVNNSKVHITGWGGSAMTTVNSNSYYFDGTNTGIDAVFSVYPTSIGLPIHITYLGGSAQDEGREIQVTTNGVIYIGGVTYSSDFPTTNLLNTYSMPNQGGNDDFIVALKEGNTNLVWSTCLGSTVNEAGAGETGVVSISTDGQNKLHVGGCSHSNIGFPVDNNAGISYFQASQAGNPPQPSVTDGTVTRFDLAPIGTIVGIEDFQGTSFSYGIYPNPTAETIVINNLELINQKLHYAVYSTDGKKVHEGHINELQNKVDVTSLKAGVYFINVSNGTRTLCNKFVKIDN